MYIYLSKILPLMLLPIGIVLELSFVALLLLWMGKRKSSAAFLLTAMLVLLLSSLPIVGDKLMAGLESQYPAVTLEAVPVSECVVMLGGAVEPALAPRIDVELFGAADRVFKTASLYHAGKANVLIIAGGYQPWSPFKLSEAEAVQSILVDWGVPESAILLDTNSRNTRENAINSKVLLEESGCGRPLLVTSAAHMKRSVAAFASLGVDVFPVSVDVRVVQVPEYTLMSYVPSTDALKMTTDAMREWLGQKVYQCRGW